jgi:ribosomal protein S18 acetylase RimI-like enzyme
MSIQIRKLDAHETPKASPVIAEAMMVEPGFAAVLPDENVRRRVLVSRMKDSIETAMSHDAVFAATDEETGKILGAAIWGPPGAYPPAEDGATGDEVPSYLADVNKQIIEGLQAFDDNCNRHFPDEPVWYLKLLGVDPEGQGRGIGSTLLRESLRELDEDGFPAYLETGTERNVRFYKRFGFEVRKAEVLLAPGSTPHWTMIRPARIPAMA